MKGSDITDRFQDSKQHLHATVERHAEELTSQAQMGRHYLEEQAQHAKARARELSHEAETLVKARPWLAIGAAALIGVALARLLR